MTENDIGRHVVDSAINVHRELGPGLLESVYKIILTHELQHAQKATSYIFPANGDEIGIPAEFQRGANETRHNTYRKSSFRGK